MRYHQDATKWKRVMEKKENQMAQEKERPAGSESVSRVDAD
ncbi:hypothetical protein ACNKHU_22355 [Shigella flexneri]